MWVQASRISRNSPPPPLIMAYFQFRESAHLLYFLPLSRFSSEVVGKTPQRWICWARGGAERVVEYLVEFVCVLFTGGYQMQEEHSITKDMYATSPLVWVGYDAVGETSQQWISWLRARRKREWFFAMADFAYSNGSIELLRREWYTQVGGVRSWHVYHWR